MLPIFIEYQNEIEGNFIENDDLQLHKVYTPYIHLDLEKI